MENYLIEEAKGPDEKPVDRLFLLHLSKQIDKNLAEKLPEVEGLDSIQGRGQYTFLIAVARMFETDSVISNLEKVLDIWFSNIIVPGSQFSQIKRNISEARK